MFLIVREQGEIKNEEGHIRMKFKMRPRPWEWVEATHQGELEDIRGVQSTICLPMKRQHEISSLETAAMIKTHAVCYILARSKQLHKACHRSLNKSK